MFYLESEHVLKIHDKIVFELGGFAGTKDIGQLESVLAHIQNDEYYPKFIDKVIHLYFGINRFHCFVDGNKRTSIQATSYFLENNGIHIPDFASKIEDISVGVAKGIIDKQDLKKIFQSIFISFGYDI